MTELPSEPDRPGVTDDGPVPAGRIVGWIMTTIGAVVIVVTVAVTLYLMVTADTATKFVGWFFVMLFFGAFPAMMGLGLVIWGGRLVRRSRSSHRPS